MGISLNPDTFTQGGLLNNADIRIENARFLLYDYDGKSDKESPGIMFDAIPLDGGNPINQFIACGDAKDWAISSDGQELTPAGDSSPSGIRNNTNLALFIKELVNLSYPKHLLDNFKAGSLNGLEIHIVRKKRPDAGQGGSSDKEILMPTKIITLPGEKSKGKTTTAAASSRPATSTSAAPAPAASSSGANVSDDHKALVLEAIKKVMDGKEKIGKVDLRKAVFGSLTGMTGAEKTAAVKLLQDENWMADNSYPISGDTVENMAA